jgi:hypothetical protein
VSDLVYDRPEDIEYILDTLARRAWIGEIPFHRYAGAPQNK